MSYKLYFKLHDKFNADGVQHDFIHSHIIEFCQSNIKKGKLRETLGTYKRVIKITKYLELVMESDAL